MSDYDAGYKAGVEAATQPATAAELNGNTYVGINYFNDEVVSKRRKKLLTKKVTKYAIVCSRSRGEGNARAYFVLGDFYEGDSICAEADTKDARSNAPKNVQVHGVFPIEIEIPL